MINNAFYDELHDAWYDEDAHPIALLRAENAVRNPWILKTLNDNGKQACRILDIGCGAGLLSNALARNGHQVTGIDLSQSSLDQAKMRDETNSVEYLCCDAKAIPYANESFDAICAMDFLEHIENPEQVIREVGRMLKPEGFFFFHTFNRNFWSYLLVIKCVDWLVPNAPNNMHVYPLFIKPDELRRMCLRFNLDIQTVRGLMPDFRSYSFWKSLLSRRITENFRFVFTKGLKVGYLGFARKFKFLK